MRLSTLPSARHSRDRTPSAAVPRATPYGGSTHEGRGPPARSAAAGDELRDGAEERRRLLLLHGSEPPLARRRRCPGDERVAEPPGEPVAQTRRPRDPIGVALDL